jgi:hypothetical protein
VLLSAAGFSPVVRPPEIFLPLSDVGKDSLGRSGHPSAVGPSFGGDSGKNQGVVKLPVKVCSVQTASEKVVLAVVSGVLLQRKPFSSGPLSVVGSVGPSFMGFVTIHPQ